MQALKRLAADESAQAIGEFAVLIGLVAVVALGAITVVGENADSIFGSIATALKR